MTEDVIEEWRPAPSYEDRYDVSNLGRIRHRQSGRILNVSMQNGNYAVYNPYNRDRKRQIPYRVHRAVLLAFVGPPPDGYVGAHLDGDTANNCLSNLAWVTPAENTAHMNIHGTQMRGDARPNAVLTEEQVREIFALRSAGLSERTIARRFAIGHGHVHHILRGKIWNHVFSEIQSLDEARSK